VEVFGIIPDRFLVNCTFRVLGVCGKDSLLEPWSDHNLGGIRKRRWVSSVIKMPMASPVSRLIIPHEQNKVAHLQIILVIDSSGTPFSVRASATSFGDSKATPIYSISSKTAGEDLANFLLIPRSKTAFLPVELSMRKLQVGHAGRKSRPLTGGSRHIAAGNAGMRTPVSIMLNLATAPDGKLICSTVEDMLGPG
jgi:hypothetical protein